MKDAKMQIAASTHNAKHPLAAWLKDLLSLGIDILEIEYVKVPEAVRRSPRRVRVKRVERIKPEDLETIREFLRRRMIRVVGIEAGALAFDDPQQLSATERRIRRVIDLAYELNAGIVSFTPSLFSRGTVPLEAMAAPCTRLVHYAEARKLHLALENGEKGSDKLLKTPTELSSLLRLVGSPNLGVCLDVSAAATYEFDVARFASALLPQVLIVHINDITRDLRFKNIIVGLGDIEFPPFLRLFKGTDVPFVIEIFSGYGAIDVFLCKKQIERLLHQLSANNAASKA